MFGATWFSRSRSVIPSDSSSRASSWRKSRSSAMGTPSSACCPVEPGDRHIGELETVGDHRHPSARIGGVFLTPPFPGEAQVDPIVQRLVFRDTDAHPIGVGLLIGVPIKGCKV